MVENGCSLEDCHTNLFALADLSGIKWRRLTVQTDTSNNGEPLEDAVLTSYSKCLQADLLCVWRRQPKGGGAKGLVDHSVASHKELWLFWYGDEPLSLQNYLSPDLYEVEMGSWENGTLSYECRTLIFKALHNLIERCLVSQRFVRMGKWFVQAYDNQEQFSKESSHLSMSFNFFLHGDSTVCASVDVRCHPPLFNIQHRHIQAANSLTGLPVVLSPYGLAGNLTGRFLSNSDPKTESLFNEWNKYYCLFNNDNENNNNINSNNNNNIINSNKSVGSVQSTCATPNSNISDKVNSNPPSNANNGDNMNKNNSMNAGNNEALPSFVEVIIAGMRLQYPSCYVKVTQEADDEAKAVKQPLQQTATSPDIKARKMSKQQMKMMNPKRLMEMRGSVGLKVIDKAWEDWVLASGLSTNNSQQGMEVSDQVSGKTTQWDFANPAQKFNCHCHKSKVAKSQAPSKAASTTSFSSPFTPTVTSSNSGTFSSTKGLQSLVNYGSSGLSAWKHQQAKSENHPVRLHKNQTPYHRRHASLTSHNKDLPLSDLINFSLSPTFATFKNNPFNKDNLKNVNTINTSQFGSSSTNLPNNSSNASYNKSFFYQASESSPNSAAPSPLLASQVISSASTQNGDPTMPTLSPQPSSKTTDCKVESNQKQSILNNLKQYNHQVDNGLTKSSTLSSTSTSFLFQHFSVHDFKCDSDTLLNNVNIEAPLKNELVSRVRSANVGRTWVEAKLKRKAQRVRDRPILKSMFEEDDEEEKANTLNLHNNGSETKRYHPYPPSSLQLHLNDSSNNTTQNPLDNRLINRSVGSGLNAYDPANEARSNIPRNRSMLTTTNLEQSIVEPNENHDDYRAAGGLLNNMNNKQNPVVPTLMTEDDLKPNIQDLDKMFDTDEEVDPDSPTLTLKHDKPREMTTLSQNISTSKLLNSFTAPPASFPQGLSVKDLSRMFPTPPSADNPCSEPSPLMHTSIEAEHHDLQQHPFIREELALVSANLTNLKKNCGSLFKFPILTKLPASSQYKCINLHSSYAPYPFVYKPQLSSSSSSSVVSFMSSQRQQASKTNSVTAASISNHESIPNHQQEQQKYMQPQQSNLYQKKDISTINQQQQSNATNVLNNNNSQQFQHNFQQMNQQLTPLTYDLMSPASNTSSINKQLHSIENNNSIINEEHQIKGLTLNIGLSDSILNIFKDQNFDSCTLCACNRNIQGADINMYLPLSTLSLDHNDDQFRCTCAFSAIINRRYGHNSGLFYEDEVEITGHHHKRFNTKNAIKIVTTTSSNNSSLNNNTLLPNNNNSNAISPYNNTNPSSNQLNEITAELFSLFREQFSSQFPGAYVVDTFNVQAHKNSSADDINFLEMKDCTKVCYSALGLTTPPKSSEQTSCVHKWSFYQASAPLASNSREVVRLLKRLQPLLQDAIQKRRTTRSWESVYTISGPLTWKDFHLLAGRGSRETSEPKSLPCLLVGQDKHWLNIAPHSVRHWERMMLGPLGEPKDVFFLAIAPDNDLVVNQTSLFFKQLGVVYEQCRLGKHRCLMDKPRDLVVRVGRKADDSTLDDQWFWDIGNSSTASKLRLYAKNCSKLANEITKRLNEKRKLYEEATRRQCIQGGNRFSISNPDLPPFSYYHNHLHPPFNQTSHNNLSSSASCNSLHFPSSFHDINNSFFSNDKKDSLNITSGGGASSNDVTDNDTFDQSGFSSEVIAAGQLPYVVLYIIDPFNYTYHSSSSSSSSSRLGMLGILKCYQKLIKMLPEDMQLCVQLQIIPQQLLLNPQNQQSAQHFKNISFSVYTACKRQLKHTVLGRSLTSFGPAFSAKNQVQKISQQQIQPSQQQLVPYNNNNSSPKLYLNNIKLSQGSIFTSSLFCPPFVLAPPYCQVASILQPENWKEQAEKSGILLCAYCLSEDQRFLLVSVVDNTGELLETTCVNIENSRRKVRRYVLIKMWEFLMGVVSTTTRAWRLVVGRFGRLGHGELRDWTIMFNKKNLLASSQQLKKMCSSSSSSQCPSILSACLVSTEMHPFIHIMLDSVKKEESQSSKRQLNTPRDASCSHILVYPTSATAQATDNSTSDTHMDFTTNELLNAEELFNGIETEDADINDFWSNLDDRLEDNHHLYDTTAIDPQQSKPTVASTMAAMENEENISLNLLQQPQAMGFYVSTAPPGPLPQWFWSSCPQRQDHLPVCFKASLHLHSPSVQQNQDDLIHHSSNHKKTTHPLDSYLTCDVLRYVLETYNALSWLTIDPCTNDRKCCLPVHMMVLMQLYHGLNTFL